MKGDNTARDLFALAIEKYQKGKFPEAIEAFNQSLVLKEDWETYQGLGLALYLTWQYQHAVDAFDKSLVLKEDWHTYQALGWALYHTKQYPRAIDAFDKSLVLKKDWQTYQGLGLALHLTEQYQHAVDALNQSLALKEDGQSYQGLGWALFKMQQYPSAIEAFNQSLEMKEHWQSYQGLGLALFNRKQYEPAIDAILNWWRSSGRIEEQELLAKCLRNAFHNKYGELSNFLCASIAVNSEDLNKLLVAKEDKMINELHKSIKQNKLPNQILRVFSFVLQQQATSNTTISKNHEKILSNFRTDNANLIPRFEKKRKEILVLGVSHSMLFDGIPGVNVFTLGAGTMYSIGNPNSRTGHYRRIKSILIDRDPSETILVFNFGEVDLRMHINRIIKKENKSLQAICDDVLKRYLEFIDQIKERGFDVIISGPHCGGGDAFTAFSITASITERNNACAYMNDKLASECMIRSIPFITLFDLAVDQTTLIENTSLFEDYSHLLRPPNIIGKSIQSLLKERLERAIVELECKSCKSIRSNYYGSEIKTFCRILISNIPGWKSGAKFMPRKVYQKPSEIQDQRIYRAIIELPFPVHPKEVALSFNKNRLHVRTHVQAIFENYNPAIQLNDNVISAFRQKIRCTKDQNCHYFLEKDSTNRQSRFFAISISQAQFIKLKSISISRYI